ncbi:MAG: hypothetical protein OEW04_03225 [Nitrospirota bacterium]|nr:hypothetical protein [Nitrospirota bacterium]
MKKMLAVISVLSIFVFGTLAFAHGPGAWGGVHMMDCGYGGHMIRPGHGHGHFYGCADAYDQKFLDETAALRKELHSKKFDYAEALRNPEADPKAITELEKEIRDLQDEIHEKAPDTAGRGHGGYAYCR